MWRFSCNFLYLLLTFVGIFATTAAASNSSSSAWLALPPGPDLVCELYLNDIITEDASTANQSFFNNEAYMGLVSATDDFWSCHPILIGKDGQRTTSPYMYTWPQDAGLSEELLSTIRSQLLQPDTPVFVRIPSGWLDEATATVHIPDTVELVSEKEALLLGSIRRRSRRILAPSTGTRHAIVLRVVAPDSEPTFSRDELYALTYTDDISLTKQMRKCSGGMMEVLPAKRDGVYDGVLNVRIKKKMNKRVYGAIVNEAFRIVNNDILGGEDIRDYVDFVMLVIPPGSEGSWAAFGGLYGKQTVYNNKWGGFIGGTMHELGWVALIWMVRFIFLLSYTLLTEANSLFSFYSHNMGLLHSNEKGIEYEGKTGYMGSAPQTTHFPVKCYNGQNHWHLGWYKNYKKQYSWRDIRNSPKLIKVAAFTDNELLPTETREFAVIVRVGNYYMQYNRAKTFNVDTSEKKDSLTIVKYVDSVGTDLKAGLTLEDPIYEDSNLKVQVCQRVGGTYRDAEYLTVSIGKGRTDCSGYDETSEPTPRPTQQPTPEPTPWPTPPPTPLPTPYPTPRPTPRPVLTFTPRPTVLRTPSPTSATRLGESTDPSRDRYIPPTPSPTGREKMGEKGQVVRPTIDVASRATPAPVQRTVVNTGGVQQGPSANKNDADTQDTNSNGGTVPGATASDDTQNGADQQVDGGRRVRVFLWVVLPILSVLSIVMCVLAAWRLRDCSKAHSHWLQQSSAAADHDEVVKVGDRSVGITSFTSKEDRGISNVGPIEISLLSRGMRRLVALAAPSPTPSSTSKEFSDTESDRSGPNRTCASSDDNTSERPQEERYRELPVYWNGGDTTPSCGPSAWIDSDEPDSDEEVQSNHNILAGPATSLLPRNMGSLCSMDQTYVEDDNHSLAPSLFVLPTEMPQETVRVLATKSNGDPPGTAAAERLAMQMGDSNNNKNNRPHNRTSGRLRVTTTTEAPPPQRQPYRPFPVMRFTNAAPMVRPQSDLLLHPRDYEEQYQAAASRLRRGHNNNQKR